MKYHVYCLFRPGEHQPCYVGATHQPNKRRINHARRYGKGIVLVVWNILDTVPEAARREADLIAEFKALGITLDNREDAHLYYGCNKRETWQNTNEATQSSSRTQNSLYSGTCRDAGKT